MGASASNGSAPTSVPSPLEARASTVGQRGPQGGGGRTFLAWVAGAFIPRQVSAFCSSIFNFPPRRSAIAPLDTQRSGGTFLPTASGRRGVAVGGANALGESDSPSTVAAVKPLSSGAAVESLPQNPAAAPPVVSERRNRKGKLKNGGKGSGQKKQEQVMKLQIVQCVKDGDVDAAIAVFEKAEKEGVVASASVLEMLIRTTSDAHRRDSGLKFFALLRVHQTPNESAFANMIREASGGDNPDFTLAEQLLNECIEKCAVIRLRTVQPLLAGLLKAGRLDEGIALYERSLAIQPDILDNAASSNIAPVEEVFVLILTACAGALAPPLPDGSGSGYGSESGSEAGSPATRRVVKALQGLAKACLGVSKSSADALVAAFSSRANIVSIEPSGYCEASGVTLQRFPLSPSERATVREGLLTAAGLYGETQARKLQEFHDYFLALSEGPGGGVTAVVDAPNVAYARQNFEGGQFSYHQVDLVVRSLVEMGHKVLVLMPGKYMQTTVPNHARWNGADRKTVLQHEVTPDERALLEKWEAAGQMFATAQGANDDWYWMMSTVTGEAPPLAVSNDEMRDHRLALLATRPFIRWKATSLARFSFDHQYDAAAIADGSLAAPSLSLSPPRNFGVEVQMSDIGGPRDAPPHAPERVFHIPVFAACEQEAARGRTLASAASTSGTNMDFPGAGAGAPSDAEWEAQEAPEPHASSWLCVRLPA